MPLLIYGLIEGKGTLSLLKYDLKSQQQIWATSLDTGRKLNVLSKFNLRPVSRRFRMSKFSRSLVHKKIFGLMWQVVFT